jgi:hypothetical protein
MMGDTFMTNSYPHFYYGGGGGGHQRILDKALSLGNDQTHIIPAHGQLSSDKQTLRQYLLNSQQWINRIQTHHQAGHSAEVISQDEEIIRLSTKFNNGQAVNPQRRQQNIAKVIATDFVSKIPVTDSTLMRYSGLYHHSDGQIDEILVEDGRLILRSIGAYIYELIPIEEHRFQIRGQVPPKYVTFNSELNKLTFTTNKVARIASRR